MSPAESEGLNKKSLVLPETKISLKLIRSSGIVKRGILEALLAPVERTSACTFEGAQIQVFEVKNSNDLEAKKSTNDICISGDFWGLSSKRPKTKQILQVAKTPVVFFRSQITTHSFSRKKFFRGQQQKNGTLFYENQIPKIFSCRLF